MVRTTNRWAVPMVMLVAVGLLATAGCVGTLAHALYIVRGMKVKAPYSGLQNQRVAVVVVSDSSAYGPTEMTQMVSQAISVRLARNVKKINVIPSLEIDNWRDMNAWNETDFVQIGRAVGADKLVAVELSNYSIHEGTTLYKGRCRLLVTVYDMAGGGQSVFVLGPTEFQFPKHHGRPAISTEGTQFEAAYIGKLADYIARQFYDHERVDDFADDAIAFD